MTQIRKIRPSKPENITRILHPIVKEWFFNKFENFSEAQKNGVLNIWKRKDILISAPTGGTKTLTSFLSIINYLVSLSEKGKLEDKIYALYTSPLKALSNDIHKNLEEPLHEINELAKSKGIKLQKIRVALRTGDTTSYEKSKMSKTPPHILVTTPETLAITLTSKKFIEHYRSVEFCVVDEIHSLGNKRGVYLSLSLERLNEISKKWPTKIGLSATIEPLEEVAKYLVGIDKKRTVGIAKVPSDKKLDVEILTPVKDLINHQGINKELYNLLDKLIQEHKTTLIFTNTRSATERIVNHLIEKFPKSYSEGNIAAHHSSLSKTHRNNIEEHLRNGKLKTVVCSTSLELGIDIGYIDLVVLLGSPKASSRALQRVGRAGHKLHETAKGRFIVMDRDDLVECSVIQKEMIENKIDNIHFPENCLDVLSQQIYGMAINKVWDINNLLKTIRKSYCYQKLTKDDFYSVISYLSGEYGLEQNRVYRKIWYDKNEKKLGKSGKLARVIYMTNIGTIPEESFVMVKNAKSGEPIGAIDESFMNRMKKGDVFVLGGKKHLYRYTRGMNLYVSPDVKRAPTIPSWFSEMLPLSFESSLEINKIRKLINERFEKKESKTEIIKFIKNHLYISEFIAEEIYDYFEKQYNLVGLPHTEKIIVERYYEGKKKYLLVSSMYGRRVNDALSRALAYLMGKNNKRDIEIGISDSGFYFAGEKLDIENAFKKLNSKNVEEILKEAIEKTDILTKRFRHCATRSLMILRNYKGQNKSVRKQQMKSHFLIAAVKKISEDFPILREAKREVMEDLMDIKNTKKVLNWIDKKSLKIDILESKLPSPFALHLLLQGRMDLLKMEDKQDFLKRMHQVYNEEINKKKRGFTESFLHNKR